MGKTFKRTTQKRFAGPEDIEKLLGVSTPADGPETAADSPGHDDTIFIVIHSFIKC